MTRCVLFSRAESCRSPGEASRTAVEVATGGRTPAILGAVLGASALVMASGCGSVASTGEGLDAGSTAAMVLAGCSVIGGGIPLPNNSPDATRLTEPVIAAATPGRALSGIIRMLDAQADATTLLVQVRGAADHLVCPLSASERATNRIDLSRLTVMAGPSPTGTQVVYFAVQDAMGNVSGYATGMVSFGAPAPLAICGAASGPLQILGQQVAAPTAQFSNLNGPLQDYVADPQQKLAVMAQGRIYLDMGTCTSLRLGSDPTGTKAVGWDDVLLVEYRSTPSATVSQAWFYAQPGAPGLINVRTSRPLARAEDATIPGSALAPPVASDKLFGYPGRAINLMPQMPGGSRVFELTLSALDYYYTGSTTDVWLFAQ